VAARFSRRRGWVYPVIVLSAIAIAVFSILYTIDRLQAGLPGNPGSYFAFDPETVASSVGTLSSIIAAVLGIIITVVSIIVQLSAERYTQVTEMFFRDRTNLAVMGFYVVGCMLGIFTSFSLGTGGFVPRITLTAMMLVALVCFGLMAPYFTYVFDFLQPQKIIARIRGTAAQAAEKGLRSEHDDFRAEAQAAALAGLEQLTDITINAVSGKDKIIATAGVDALKDLAVSYLKHKRWSQAAWFKIGPRIRENPDFVSMSPESLDVLEERRTWLEFKVLRQYQAIYGEALTHMRDINYVVAIDTRYIGEQALRVGDTEALTLAVKFFNTYMRATLNAKDVRTAYNVLNQYRLLAEALVRAGWHDKAVEVAGFLKYYAHLGFGMKLAFVTETVAYDLCSLCETAHEQKSPAEQRLLSIFLEVDQPEHEGEVHDTGLRGVRKAQAKLASYYLLRDGAGEALARRIQEDMAHENPERLRSIRDELLNVTAKDFWEVIDRGTNFDYLSPERKERLAVFFSWFDRLAGDDAPAATTTPAPVKEASQ
jgi:hypothetical protein